MSATGSSELQKAIEKLVAREPKWKAFEQKPTVGAKPGAVATGRPASAAGPAAAASQEEDSYEGREYFPERELKSSDGLITFAWRPIKSILLKDGSRMIYQEPPA